MVIRAEQVEVFEAIALDAFEREMQIPEPEARRQYTEAIAANEDKSEAYGKQIQLRKMNKWATQRVEAYIHRCYLKSPRSREELASVVEKHISGPSRAERLNALLVHEPETEE